MGAGAWRWWCSLPGQPGCPGGNFGSWGGMAVIFLAMGGARLPVWGIPIQIFGLGALVPISCYSGRKATRHPLIQWGFYLFYPGHLVALWLIRNMIG